jgi:hypothetical protein
VYLYKLLQRIAEAFYIYFDIKAKTGFTLNAGWDSKIALPIFNVIPMQRLFWHFIAFF